MTRARRLAAGFTLMELVVAITISAIIMGFVTMFIAAPVDAYDRQARRTQLAAASMDAWPRMENDLRAALPNSVRTLRNGPFVVIEMLEVADVARYMEPTNAPFKVAGTMRGLNTFAPTPGVYLSVGNTGVAGSDAYTLTGSMTPASTVSVATLPGNEQQLTVTPVANLTATSPRHRIYLVTGPVTYLCDETQGTIRRYSNYTVFPNQTSWDSPAEFNVAGVPGTLVARGITACNFVVFPLNGGTQQTAALHLTSTDASGDTVTMLHTYRTEYVP